MWALLLASMALAQDPALEARLLGPQGPMVGPVPPIVGPAAPVVEPTVAPAAAPAQVAVPVAPTAPATAPAAPLSFLDELEAGGEVASAGSTTSMGLPWWVPLVALVGAGAFYYNRKKTVDAQPADLPAIQVIARANIGGAAGVAIVEVDDNGRRRRLLLGTGDKQPVLLTELDHRDGLVDQIGSDRVERPVSARSSVLSRASSKVRKPAPANRPSNDWMAVDPSSDLGPRKAAARVLINQEMNRRAAT